MKSSFLFVFVFCAILNGLGAVQLSFPFGNSVEDVATQSTSIDFDYKGSVNVQFATQQNADDLYLCINWLVPAESPAGVSLDEVWEGTCHFTQLIEAGSSGEIYNFSLRAGVNYFSLAVLGDGDSDGLPASYDATLDVTFETCPPSSFGPECIPYTQYEYDEDYPITIPSVGEAVAFIVPTSVANNTRFVKNLELDFEFDDEGPDTKLNAWVRWNGPFIDEETTDFICPENFDEKCLVPTPPLGFSDGYYISVLVYASSEVNAVLTAEQNTCGKKLVPKENGKDCQTYETLNSKPGKVSKYKGKEYFVFDNTVNIAIGGLDSYDQEDFAPIVYAQIDNIPTEDRFVLASNGSMTNVVQMDLSSGGFEDSQITLFVDTKKSYAIWIIDIEDNVTCASGCKNGVCDEDTFVCDCSGNKNYDDIGCDHKKSDFTIEYIILIAVGGLLVIAMVIGVPMYCCLNKADSSYETVH